VSEELQPLVENLSVGARADVMKVVEKAEGKIYSLQSKMLEYPHVVQHTTVSDGAVVPEYLVHKKLFSKQ